MKPFICIIASIATVTSAFANQVSEEQLHFVEKYESQKARIVQPENALINTDPEPDLTIGFVDLYNGRNLDGWSIVGGHCTFEPQGDIVVGTTIEGSPSTYLNTDKDDYTDFIFTAELKWVVPGNSGFMFRSDYKYDKEGKPFTVKGPQVEMEANNARQRNWSGGLYGQSDGGWIYPLWLDAHKEARAAIDNDDWNRVTVLAKGDTIKTWINGVPAAHWTTDKYQSGFFSMQVHSGKEGLIHFRNLKVKELAAH